MIKYVEEIYEEKGESVYHEEMATGSGTGKPVVTKHKGQPSPQSNPVSTMFIPSDPRTWNDLPAVDYVSGRSLPCRVSKIMTQMLRHHGSHREDDGAIKWNTLLTRLCRDFEKENAGRWSNKEWLHLLQRGSDKKRFQQCLKSDCLIIYMRAIQRHSGGTKVDPTLLDNVLIPYNWSEYLYHVGCSHDAHSILQSGLIAGRNDSKRRQTVFFTALNPMTDVPEEEYQELSIPRTVHYKSKWKMIPRCHLLHWSQYQW